MIGFLWRERTIAGPGFNRRLIPPAALMVHLSIGKIYAFSVFKNPLVERFGTGLTPIVINFSFSIVMLGLPAARLSPHRSQASCLWLPPVTRGMRSCHRS
jgi:hypothetical protein